MTSPSPLTPVIVDIGGYIGDFSLYKENFQMTCKNVELNNFADRIEVINKAVSNARTVTLNVEKSESEEIHVSAYWYGLNLPPEVRQTVKTLLAVR